MGQNWLWDAKHNMRLVGLSKGQDYRSDRLLCNQNTPVNKKHCFKEIILLCKNKKVGRTGSD